jgi:hypothetical protein
LAFPTNNRPFLFEFLPLLPLPKKVTFLIEKSVALQNRPFSSTPISNSDHFCQFPFSSHFTSLEEQKLFDSPEIDFLRPREPSDTSRDSIKSDHFQFILIEHFAFRFQTLIGSLHSERHFWPIKQ